MTSPLFGRVAIIGTGVMGASIAAALRARNLACHVAVYDTDQAQCAQVLNAGMADSSHSAAQEAAENADIVILSVPPSQLVAAASAIANHLSAGCIVTDITSVKRAAIANIHSQLPGGVFFVPGHPIAGSEKSGASAADASLFEGKRVILTPTEAEVLSEPVNRIRHLWEALGAQVEYMPADLHDRLYAYVSHLPQLAAFACAASVPSNSENCDGVLRLGASSPSLWAEICLANADFIHEALDEFTTFLGQMNRELVEIDEVPSESENSDRAPELLCAVIGLCLVATALLLEQQTGIPTSRYSGNGFKDMTAAAGNHSDSVLSAISLYPKVVAQLLESSINKLHRIGAALSSGERGNLLSALVAA